MKLVLVTVDSLRFDSVPNWFIKKHNPTQYLNAWTYNPTTIPSLLSFYTGAPPEIHGVKDHHKFFKFSLRKVTIFRVLSRKGIKTGFTTNEWILFKTQWVNDTNVFPFTCDNIRSFLSSSEKVFLALHYYHPTHIPYNSNYTLEVLKSHSSDSAFLEEAKKQYLCMVDRTFKDIEKILEPVNCRVILTADHGEAFGEEGEVGHDKVFLECTLHIPLLILDGKGLTIEKKVSPAFVFDYIKSSW